MHRGIVEQPGIQGSLSPPRPLLGCSFPETSILGQPLLGSTPYFESLVILRNRGPGLLLPLHSKGFLGAIHLSYNPWSKLAGSDDVNILESAAGKTGLVIGMDTNGLSLQIVLAEKRAKGDSSEMGDKTDGCL